MISFLRACKGMQDNIRVTWDVTRWWFYIKKGKLHEVKFLRFETKSSNQIVIELANYV